MNTNFLIQMFSRCQSHIFPFRSLRRARTFSLTPCFSRFPRACIISLTPCFSWVWQRPEKIKRFNGLSPLNFVIVILLATSAQAQQALDPKPADSSPDSSAQIVAETPYSVAARDANQKTWSKVTWESNSLTGELTAKTNSFIELATASAHLVNGAWVDSSDQIEITKTGAQATNSQHQVSFLGNINSSGAINLTLPEGDKHLVGAPIGLSYFDSASGKSVLISEIKDSVGTLLESGSEVLYQDSLTDFEGDILYQNRRDGLEPVAVYPPCPMLQTFKCSRRIGGHGGYTAVELSR